MCVDSVRALWASFCFRFREEKKKEKKRSRKHVGKEINWIEEKKEKKRKNYSVVLLHFQKIYTQQ